MLLLRPSLLSQAKKYTTDNRSSATNEEPLRLRLGDGLQLSIHKLCLETAHELLREMHEKLGSLRQNSAWHVLLCKDQRLVLLLILANLLTYSYFCSGIDPGGFDLVSKS